MKTEITHPSLLTYFSQPHHTIIPLALQTTPHFFVVSFGVRLPGDYSMIGDNADEWGSGEG
ncbi:MAG: hypothetical protein P9M05_03375, partial [Candidatus Stygibacter australis]|nr:hypothetical protein [Candidatus Stygibacter australis]